MKLCGHFGKFIVMRCFSHRWPSAIFCCATQQPEIWGRGNLKAPLNMKTIITTKNIEIHDKNI